MIKTAIIGGTGYTAGELIRLILNHPKAQISYIHSNTFAGQAISKVHNDLIGETDLMFTNQVHQNIDLVFLCLPHGASEPFLKENHFEDPIKIIDLSRDFRLEAEENDFIYGLPELNRTLIKSHNKIANCGCFATAIQLALLPLAKAQLLQKDLHIHAITGSTGAGKSPGSTTHFSWRNNNVSIYKAFKHQHLDEINQSLQVLQPGFQQEINFIPVRGNFSRGIFASMYTEVSESLEEIKLLYQEYYQSAPFVFISDESPDLKQVINTNKCLIYLEKHDNKLLVTSIIDNLLKGASGQAIQNMNLIFNRPETEGLKLKASAF